jgi:hypothetical protein
MGALSAGDAHLSPALSLVYGINLKSFLLCSRTVWNHCRQFVSPILPDLGADFFR